MPEIAQATIVVTPVLEGAQQTITKEMTGAAGPAGDAAGKAAGQNFGQSLGKGMSKVGGTMTKAVTAPIAGIAAASVAAWKEVDTGLDTIVTKTGASGDALAEMEGILGNLATSIPTDFETAGAAIGQVNTRFGLTGEKLEKLSGQFIKFADINGQDVSSSVDSVSKMLGAFGMSADDAGKMLDALNVVGQQTGVDVGQLADTVAANAKQFQEMGLSAEEAAAFLGSASMAGLDSSAAMMGMKTAMKNASEEGVSLSEKLQEFEGVMSSNASESDKLAYAYELFGTRAGAAIENAVANGSVNLSDFSASLGEFEGSVSNTFAEAQDPMDDFQMTLNELKQVGANLVETAGPVIADVLGRFSDGISKVKAAWDGLSPGTQDMIIKIAGIAAVAGPLLMIGGKVIGGISKIAGGLGGLIGNIGGLGSAASTATGPVAAAGGSFASMAGSALQLIAMGAGIWLIANGLSQLAQSAIQLSQAGGAAIATFFGMVGGIAALLAVAAAVGPMMSAGALGFLAFGAAALAIGGAINLASRGIGIVIDAVGRLVDTIASNAPGITSIVESIGNAVGNVIDKVSDGIVKIIDAISGGLSKVLDSIAGIIKAVGEAALNAGTGFEKLANAVIRLVKDTSLGDLAGTLIAVSKGVKAISKSASEASSGAAAMNKIGAAFKLIGVSAKAVSLGMTQFGKTTMNATKSISRSFTTMNLGRAMQMQMRAATNAANAGIRSLRSAFANTSFRFNQHIAVPHFSMSGSFNAEKGTVPSVSTRWYKAAESTPYLFQHATLFGAGEANDEVLYGRQALMRDIKEAAGGRNITMTFNVSGADNPAQFADKVARELEMRLRTA